MNAPDKRRCWRPRFRLATFFWIMLTAALALGWLTERQRLLELHERALEASRVEHEIRIAAITREGWMGLWPDDALLWKEYWEGRHHSARINIPWKGEGGIAIEVADVVVRRRYSQFLSAPNLAAAFNVAKFDDEQLERGFRRELPFIFDWPSSIGSPSNRDAAPTTRRDTPEIKVPEIPLAEAAPDDVCRRVIQFEQSPSQFEANFSDEIAALFESNNDLYCAIGAREISKKSAPGRAASIFLKAYHATDDVFRRELLACLYLGQLELDGQ